MMSNDQDTKSGATAALDANTKCTVEEGKFVRPCPSLASAAEVGHPRGKQKGIYAWVLSTPEGPTRTFFGVKSGDHKDRGLALNFCPFCGERIDAPFTDNAPHDLTERERDAARYQFLRATDLLTVVEPGQDVELYGEGLDGVVDGLIKKS